MKKIATTLSLILALNSNLYANDSLKKFRQGDYKSAKNGLLKLVKSKNKYALYYYGLMELHGYTIKKDTAKGLVFIKKAGEKGNLEAQLFLGQYSLNILQSPKKAFYWFEKAAKKGNLDAQMYVAGAYNQGFGIKKNASSQQRYIIKAAKQGNKEAQYHLGKKFLKHRSYRSKKLGIAWLKKSAKQNYAPAYFELLVHADNYYAKRQSYINQLEKQNTAQAEFYIAKYFLSSNNMNMKFEGLKKLKSAAEKGYVQALYELGIMHQSGDLNIINDKQAFKEMLEAATKGYKPAQKQLSLMYKEGVGIKSNMEKYSSWLKRSNKTSFKEKKQQLFNWLTNENNNAKLLSSYKYNGILSNWQALKNTKDGVINQSPQMVKLTKSQIFQPKLTFTKPTDLPAFILADQVKLQQKNNVINYDFPIEKIKNKEPSANDVKNIYSQALLGNSEAQFILGQYHQYGIGVDKDLNAAAQWYFSSAKQNYLPAEYNLGLLFLKGEGVKQNFEKASYWLNRTAFKGNTNAQYSLGVIYQHGYNSTDPENMQKIPQDLEQATFMYHLSSGDGNKNAKFQLAQLYSKKPLNNYVSNFKKNKQHNIITNLYEQAYNAGIEQAKMPLAYYYVKQDLPFEKTKWAFDVLSLQENIKDPAVALLLALMNERGIGTKINIDEAIKWYKVAAKSNISAAKFALGSYYYQGNKVNKNINKAERLLNEAAIDELPYANYNLAFINYQQNKDYMTELNKAANAGYIKAKLYIADQQLLNSTDIINAAKTYHELAAKGLEQADLKLGFMYQKGIHFNKNLKLAQKYYLNSANKNNVKAQYQLGFMNQVGQIGKAKPNKAIYWYRKAANKNFVPAMIGLGYLQEKSKHNFKQANYWYNKASIKNNPIAKYNLALMLDYGKGIKANDQKAVELYKQASKAGVLPATINLAKYYYSNKDNKEMLDKSIYFFKQASLANDPHSNYQLGKIYEVGLAMPININKAKQHYQIAAKLGNIDAHVSLGRLHQSKIITEHSDLKAFEHYQTAARQGSQFANYQMAKMMFYGVGTEHSTKKALVLLNKLKAKGYAPATVMLKNIKDIEQAKIKRKKQEADLKKLNKKQENKVTALPKFEISLKKPEEILNLQNRNVADFSNPNLMYLNAIEELEQGSLYHSKTVLSKLIDKFPNYKPAQHTYQQLELQEQKLKHI